MRNTKKGGKWSMKYKKSINYNIVYEKTLLFRNQKNNNKELDKYLEYHKNLII